MYPPSQPSVGLVLSSSLIGYSDTMGRDVTLGLADISGLVNDL